MSDRALPITPSFRERKQNTFEQVRAASGRPDPRFKRIRRAEKQGVKLEDVADSGDFDARDAALAMALTSAAERDDLKRRVNEAKETAQLCDTIERVGKPCA